MKHKPVESSNIESVAFKNGVLHVKYKRGGTYEYTGVSHTDHQELMDAKSIGKHLNTMGLVGKRLEEKP